MNVLEVKLKYKLEQLDDEEAYYTLCDFLSAHAKVIGVDRIIEVQRDISVLIDSLVTQFDSVSAHNKTGSTKWPKKTIDREEGQVIKLQNQRQLG